MSVKKAGHDNCANRSKEKKTAVYSNALQKHFLRLVPTADKTTITIISQINNHNDTHNIYIPSKNLLMFTQRNRCNILTQNLLS